MAIVNVPPEVVSKLLMIRSVPPLVRLLPLPLLVIVLALPATVEVSRMPPDTIELAPVSVRVSAPAVLKRNVFGVIAAVGAALLVTSMFALL